MTEPPKLRHFIFPHVYAADVNNYNIFGQFYLMHVTKTVTNIRHGTKVRTSIDVTFKVLLPNALRGSVQLSLVVTWIFFVAFQLPI